MYREEERVVSLNERSTIVVTQAGTTIAGIEWASVDRLSELRYCHPLLIKHRLPSCTPSVSSINAVTFPYLLPLFNNWISPVSSNPLSIVD